MTKRVRTRPKTRAAAKAVANPEKVKAAANQAKARAEAREVRTKRSKRESWFDVT